MFSAHSGLEPACRAARSASPATPAAVPSGATEAWRATHASTGAFRRRVARQSPLSLAGGGELRAAPGRDEQRAEPRGLELQRELAVIRRDGREQRQQVRRTSGRGPTDHVSSVRTRARVDGVGGALDHLAQPVARAGHAAAVSARPRSCRSASRGRAAGGSASARASRRAPTAGAPRATARRPACARTSAVRTFPAGSVSSEVRRDALGRRAGLLEEPRRASR